MSWYWLNDIIICSFHCDARERNLQVFEWHRTLLHHHEFIEISLYYFDLLWMAMVSVCAYRNWCNCKIGSNADDWETGQTFKIHYYNDCMPSSKSSMLILHFCMLFSYTAICEQSVWIYRARYEWETTYSRFHLLKVRKKTIPLTIRKARHRF